jgi:hypothetical protein
MCLRDFDWITNLLFSIDKNFNRKSHVEVSIGKILILILFKQLLSDNIFLGQDQD